MTLCNARHYACFPHTCWLPAGHDGDHETRRPGKLPYYQSGHRRVVYPYAMWVPFEDRSVVRWVNYRVHWRDHKRR